MADKAGVGHIVIGGQMQLVHKLADNSQYLRRRLVLQQTMLNGHQPMAGGLVQPRNHPAVPPFAEGGVDLVAVMHRVFHTQNRLYRGILTEQFLHQPLLFFQLGRVGQLQQLASAALFGVGTGKTCHFHIKTSHGRRCTERRDIDFIIARIHPSVPALGPISGRDKGRMFALTNHPATWYSTAIAKQKIPLGE